MVDGGEVQKTGHDASDGLLHPPVLCTDHAVRMTAVMHDAVKVVRRHWNEAVINPVSTGFGLWVEDVDEPLSVGSLVFVSQS